MNGFIPQKYLHRHDVFQSLPVKGTNGVWDILERALSPRIGRFLQNYPNPFDPATTIGYELPRSTDVSLGVYDTLGPKVAELVERAQEAGYHIVKFDGSEVGSGVYLCRLQVGDFVQARRLLLLR
jgi:glucuronoarabinoxylan endo-1,4-beta-xylanase